MISVIIPTKNEPQIIELINSIRMIFKKLQQNYEIIVVDKSNDDMRRKIIDSGAIIVSQTDDGLGNALKTGIKNSKGDIVITMDGDFSHDPIYIENILKDLENNDLVIGSRKIAGGNIEGWGIYRNAISSGANLVSMFLGIPVKDTTNGYRGYRKSVFEKIDLDKLTSNGYSFQIEILYKIFKSGFRISEVPIKFVNRQVGKSKLKIEDILEFITLVLKMKFSQSS